jgi:hypothetical protein
LQRSHRGKRRGPGSPRHGLGLAQVDEKHDFRRFSRGFRRARQGLRHLELVANDQRRDPLANAIFVARGGL